MMLPQIRCNHSGISTMPFVFFILCKGDNAGKPGYKPWPNSFLVRCNNQESFEFYFWLVYGLFKTGQFKTRHRGSVIPFINLQDVRDLIRDLKDPFFTHWQHFKKILEALEKLEQKKSSLAEQLLATENLQKYLLSAFLQQIRSPGK